jgi:predicted LPLAT superfamily acyltransferase
MQENSITYQWTGTTYGNGWMHKWLVRILRWTDVRIIYAFTAVFIVPVCLVLNESRSIIYRYFRQRQGYGVWRSVWHTFVNHFLFSQIVIDRFAMYAGKKFNVEMEGYDHFLQLAKQEPGFIQLSSHIGNYEIAGYTLVAEYKPFNALVYYGEKESVMHGREQMFSDTNIKMIPVSNDMSHLFMIDNALQNGETVSLPADRIFGSQKTISVPFLGKPADFPLGPFSVATMRGLDTLAVNVMKTSLKGYKIYITPLHYSKEAPRKQQMEELATAYVKELERMVKRYPDQWYNFFDFWKENV